MGNCAPNSAKAPGARDEPEYPQAEDAHGQLRAELGKSAGGAR